MVSFREYCVLCEVKASRANIERFRQVYGLNPTHFPDDEAQAFFARFDNEVKRGTGFEIIPIIREVLLKRSNANGLVPVSDVFKSVIIFSTFKIP